MKILKIHINKYKNLEDFSLDFSDSYNISVLLGKNGTGKSNIFEFITIVFKSLDLAKSPSEFIRLYQAELKQFDQVHTDFQLDYEINNRKIRIISIEEKFRLRDLQYDSNIPFKTFLDHKKQLFPKHIIAYYSGKNQRFENLFTKHLVNAEQKIIDIKRASDKMDTLELDAFEMGTSIPEKLRIDIPKENFRTLFFAKHQYAQLLLLTLFAFRGTNTAIKSLLAEYLQIDGFERFSITLRSPHFNKDMSLSGEDANKFWGANGSALKCASFLFRIAKRSFNLPSSEAERIGITSPIKEAITLLIDADKFIEEVRAEFSNASETFRHLESLMISDLLAELTLDVKRKRTNDIITFSQLSEGEQQMIATLGLMMITGDEHSLFLLDEPDTHLNPKWQRAYIDIINGLIEVHRDKIHVMITTHSPFLPQAIKSSDLILFKKENERPSVRKIDNMHTWGIEQILTSEIYELETTRSKEIEDAIVRRDELRSSTHPLAPSDIVELKALENTLENLALGSSAEEVKTNQRMKRLADIFEKMDMV